jgi:hypothetical protein
VSVQMKAPMGLSIPNHRFGRKRKKVPACGVRGARRALTYAELTVGVNRPPDQPGGEVDHPVITGCLAGTRAG